MATKVKISEMEERTELNGDEMIPMAYRGGNYNAKASTIRNFIEDSIGPIVMTQAQYNALETKEENRTYYIIEEK